MNHLLMWRAPYDEAMVAAHRAIERVPALFIGLLEQAGKLPLLPPAIAILGHTAAPRQATLEECAALTWLVAWDGKSLDARGFRSAAAVAAYRDTFDYHTSSDVREIVHIAGNARAVIDLVEHIREEAHARGLRCLGSVDQQNHAMIRVLQKLGGVRTRLVFEEQP